LHQPCRQKRNTDQGKHQCTEHCLAGSFDYGIIKVHRPLLRYLHQVWQRPLSAVIMAGTAYFRDQPNGRSKVASAVDANICTLRTHCRWPKVIKFYHSVCY
jgi:hypothetical protein